MACVLSLAFYIAFLMSSGVSDAQDASLWYTNAEECCNHELSFRYEYEDKHPYDSQLIEQCMKTTLISPHGTCEPDLCYAVKKGYAATDGTIKRDILQILLEVELDKNPDMLDKILANCVYGDLLKYPMDLCLLQRLNMCISVHIDDEVLRGCKDWKGYLYCFKMRIKVTRNVKQFL